MSFGSTRGHIVMRSSASFVRTSPSLPRGALLRVVELGRAVEQRGALGVEGGELVPDRAARAGSEWDSERRASRAPRDESTGKRGEADRQRAVAPTRAPTTPVHRDRAPLATRVEESSRRIFDTES